MKLGLKTILQICICTIIITFFMQNYMCVSSVVIADDMLEPTQEISILIEGSAYIETIHSYVTEENFIYFFLPTAPDIAECRLIGIGENDSFFLNGVEYRNNEKFKDTIKIGEIYTYTLKSENGNTEISGQLQFLQSANLGTLFIETETGNLDYILENKENKEAGTLLFLGADGKRNFYGELEYIKGRGNSTWLYSDKKSYQIKLKSDYGFYDMEEAQKWILMSNSLDPSYIRNQIVYDYAEELGMPTTESEYIDVFINGEYVGNYQIMEKIEIGEGRLEITDLETYNDKLSSSNITTYISEDGRIKAMEGIVNTQDITGGYIVEMDTLDQFELADCAFKTTSGKCYIVKSPENASIEQVTYLKDLFEEIEAAIYNKDGVNVTTQKSLEEYIDIDSWARKYLIEEVFLNYDAGSTSTYFYKDSDSVDPLVYAGPVWDYDKAMGNYAAPTAPWLDSPLGVSYVGAFSEQLMTHDIFYDTVMDQYENEMKPYIERLSTSKLDRLLDYLEASATMDSLLAYNTRNSYYSDIHSNIAFVNQFLTARIESLDEIWYEGTVYHTVYFYNTLIDQYVEKYYIKDGEYLTSYPVIASYIDIFNGWYIKDTSIALNMHKPIMEDIIFESAWIDGSLLLENIIARSENLTGITIEQEE